MDQQLGRTVLIEFWDFCRPHSLRTLPYIKAWHERYESYGLRVIGVHTGAFPPSRNEETIRAAVDRLAIRYPVVIDRNLEIWNLYGNEGWPARYLWTSAGTLFSLHYGQGNYHQSELEIQELLGVDLPPVPPVCAEDDPDAELCTPSAERLYAYSGPYCAGSVWAVLDGSGEVTVNQKVIPITTPGCYRLINHSHHTEGVLDFTVGAGVSCYATSFLPGCRPRVGGLTSQG